MYDVIQKIRNTGGVFWILVGGILLLGISYLDYITGAHISLSIFYLIPILIFTIKLKGYSGVISAIAAAAIWILIDIWTNTQYTNIFLSLWNGLIRLGFFLFPVFLLRSLEKEGTYARTDYLTGGMNSRIFRELLVNEIDRSARYHHALSIAFIDVDDFKSINDTFGHSFGDDVLRSIADTLKLSLRKTDVVARMGGDEFSILLPETGPQAAKMTLEHMNENLLKDMAEKKQPVTLSIGVLTITEFNLGVDEMLRIVDTAMYSVKNSGKNAIKYIVK